MDTLGNILPKQPDEQDEINEPQQSQPKWVKPQLYSFQRGMIQGGDTPGDVEGAQIDSYYPVSGPA